MPHATRLVLLRHRVLSALVLIPLVAGLAYAGGYWWLATIALVGVLASMELFQLLREGGYHPNMWVGVTWNVVLILSGFWPQPLPFPIVLQLGLLLTLALALFSDKPHPATDWAWTVAGATYLGALLASFVALRMRPNGLYWVALAVITTWITDSGAYFVGISLGRHQLAPRLSPKKTWEGAIGGWIVGVISGTALGLWLVRLPLVIAFSLAGVLCVLAPLGDLAESMIKRQIGVKDSGRLIPGHGGMLDRLDSLLFVIPATYYASLLLG
jgi:phosphatidate cytidylyltransferase